MLATIADLERGQQVLNPFLEIATSLSTMYEEYLTSDEGDAHLRDPGIHASELGCARRVYYTLLGEKKKSKVPLKWKKRFEHGKVVHAMVQQQLGEMARRTGGLITFDPEVKIHSRFQKIAAELHLDSSTDGLFEFRRAVGEQPHTRVIFELKTEAPDGYTDLKKPKPEHVEQVHLYMKALDVPVAWIMYYNKGDQNNTASYAPWFIAYDETIWQRIEKKCRVALQMAETRTPPDRVEGIWCEFCPYRDKDVCGPKYLAQRAARAKAAQPGVLRS